MITQNFKTFYLGGEMSGEARLKKQVEELKGKLLELAAIANNTVMEGSFSGDGILRAATLMDISHKIYQELAPPEAKEGDKVKEERDKVSDAEVKEEPKASNE